MYTPATFRSADPARVRSLVHDHPFALVITPHADGLHLSHLPCRLDADRGPHGTLEAHLARSNPHAAALADGLPTTVVFTGPHAYVSPRWYTDPAGNVPTWNYAAVHLSGTPHEVTGAEAVLALIERFTRELEQPVTPPWTLAEGRAYADRIVRGVLAFELPVERAEMKLKFSQNKAPADRLGVMAALEASHPDVTALMRSLYDADGERR